MVNFEASLSIDGYIYISVQTSGVTGGSGRVEKHILCPMMDSKLDEGQWELTQNHYSRYLGMQRFQATIA